MSNVQRYQPRRRASSRPWGFWLMLGVLLLFVFFVARSIFGRDQKAVNTNTTVANDSEITLVNDAVNAATNSNTNASPANVNAEVNGNTNVAVAKAAETVSAKNCTAAISQYGTAKKMALTFDLAAANDNARQLVQLLKENSIPASFFSTGVFAEKNKEFVASVAQAGFTVYNHGYENTHYEQLTAAGITTQLAKAAAAITAATETSPQPFFRPPFGEANATVVSAAQAAGYCTVLWTVDAGEWQADITADAAKQRVLDKARAGGIVLLNAGYDATDQMIVDLAKALRDQGYELTTLADLLAAGT